MQSFCYFYLYLLLKHISIYVNTNYFSCYRQITIFVYFPIYLAWMIFPVEPFAKIDNLRKMCNLENSCKNPSENWQIFLQVKSRKNYVTHLRHFATFLVCFHWKITWNLGKVNQRAVRLRQSEIELTLSPPVCGSRVLMSPLVYFLKRPITVVDYIPFCDIEKTSVHGSAL